MNTYNEDEQIEELKAWWEDNGRSILIAVVLAVLSFGGWSGWTTYHDKKAKDASGIYFQMVEAYDELERSIYDIANKEAAENKDLMVKLSAFQQTVTTLKEEYGSSEYANYARLLSAKYYVIEEDFEAAEKELKEVLGQNPDKSLKLLTIKRLARVMAATQKYDEALKILEIKNPGSYRAVFLELEGDIYFQQGEKEKALDSYREARELSEEASPVLDMKYFNLVKD